MANARQFVDEIAEILRAKGRQVEITETDESFGKMVWLYSPAPHWFMSMINLGAVYTDRTKRWKLMDMTVHLSSSTYKPKTKSAMKIAADVYG